MTDFSIGIGGRTCCTSAWNSAGWVVEPMHKLYIVESGGGRYAVPDGDIALEAGHLYLIPGGRPQRYSCAQRMDVWWCHFRAAGPAVERRLLALPGITSWPIGRWAAWRAVWQAIPDTIAHRRLADELRLQALLASLAADLVASQDEADDRDLARLAPALGWMEAHYRDRPDLGAAAHAAGLHPHRFHRLFRTALGCTPRAWLERRRMDLARRLLAEGATVQAAASACGYDNPFHFSRVVRRLLGASPQALRARWRDGAP